ncbi:Ferredoxin-like protein in nif region, partial [Caligus rogercresseyi]
MSKTRVTKPTTRELQQVETERYEGLLQATSVLSLNDPDPDLLLEAKDAYRRYSDTSDELVVRLRNEARTQEANTCAEKWRQARKRLNGYITRAKVSLPSDVADDISVVSRTTTGTADFSDTVEGQKRAEIYRRLRIGRVTDSYERQRESLELEHSKGELERQKELEFSKRELERQRERDILLAQLEPAEAKLEPVRCSDEQDLDGSMEPFPEIRGKAEHRDRDPGSNLWGHASPTSKRNRLQGLPISASEELEYLRANTSGLPFNTVVNIEACSAACPDNAVKMIWQHFLRTYGDGAVLASSLMSKVHSFERILPDASQGERLLELHQLCMILQSNLGVVRELNFLNDSTGMTHIWEKLPEHLRNRWRKEVSRLLYVQGVQPDFATMVQFVGNAALEFNIPAYVSAQTSSSLNHKTKKIQALTTQVEGQPMTQDQCFLIGHRDHPIIECKTFGRLDVDSRREAAASRGVCFMCFQDGHRSTDCPTKVTCGICGKGHHHLLHKDPPINVPRSFNNVAAAVTGGNTLTLRNKTGPENRKNLCAR